MLGSPLSRIKAGLRKGLLVTAGFLAAAFVLGLLRVYVDYEYDPGFSALWIYGYVGVVVPLLGVAMGYQAYSFNPRMLRFAEDLGGRVQEADYVPWGTKRRGLLVTFDSGLLLVASRNFLSFRIVSDAEGRVLPLTLDQWSSVLQGYRGAARRAFVSTRKGDPREKEELQDLAHRLGGRTGMSSVYEKSASDISLSPTSRWNAVALIAVPKWLNRGVEVRDGLDDMQRYLAGLTPA